MKINLFSKGFAIALLASASLFFVSCDKDDDDTDNVMYNVSGDASGAQEVPPVTTAATGTLTGTYNKNTNQLQYTISWSGLSGDITVAHFHGPAMIGESAGPLIDLEIETNGTSGSLTGIATISEEVEAHFLSGKMYYNLHTVLNPDGEIQGTGKPHPVAIDHLQANLKAGYVACFKIYMK